MAQEQLVVRVAPDGAVYAETKGLKGPKCLDSIALLEDLLEAQTMSSAFTSEYNELPMGRHEAIEADDDLQQH